MASIAPHPRITERPISGLVRKRTFAAPSVKRTTVIMTKEYRVFKIVPVDGRLI